MFVTFAPITRKVRWYSRMATCIDACTAAVMQRKAEARERRYPSEPLPDTRFRRFLGWLLQHHRKYS
ncbi:MAG: hypothetical protein F4X99_09015 [Gammaproteobacteria bacterium]|nr:hypothetical protein [Gammaproteobacteria bacterium]